MPLTTQTTHAFKWSLLGELASRLIAPAVFLLLARLLTPEDFGVVAAATVVISFCQAIAEAGLGKALVQRRDRIEESADIAFWINLGGSIVVMLALVVSAPWIAMFFRDERITDITRVLALQVPLAALCTVPTALLQRDLAFRELFWVRLLATGLPALLSVPMALNGLGYWALIASAITGQALQFIILRHRCDWRPRRQFNRPLARELIGFSKWVLLSGMLAWSYIWMDSLIVGHYLGAHDMGIYRTSNTLVTMVFGLAFAPLLPVLYSVYSRGGNQPDRIAEALLETARTIALVSMPLATLLVLLSPPIEAYLFGPEWAGLAPVMALLAASQGFAWLVGANGEAYRAIGRPDAEFQAMGLSLTIYLIGYFMAIQHGLLTFVTARALLVILGIAIQIWIATRLLGLRIRLWAYALAKPALVAALAAVIARLANKFTSGVAADFLAAMIFVAAYLIILCAFDRQYLNMIRKKLHGT